MVKGIVSLLLIVTVIVCEALSPISYLTSADKARLKRVFDAAQPFQDLTTAYYASLGYKLLGQQLANAQDVCKQAQTQVDEKSIESIFYASGISKALGNCPLKAATYQPTLNAALIEGITSQNLFYAVTALKNLALTVDPAKVTKLLNAARKKDDGALSLGYAFHVASQLTGDVSGFVGWIEDTVVQADEVDGRTLQFEGGLSNSAVIVSGIYRLADHSKKAPPGIDAEKAVKFSNYFLSRKQAQMVRQAYHLLDVLNVLSGNKYHIPVSVTLVSKAAVSVTQPSLTLQVSNLLGGSLGQVNVVVDSATKSDAAPVVIKKPMTAVKGQTQLFEINLTPFKLGRGIYTLNVDATPAKPDPRWVGNMGSTVIIKLETEVAIENVEIGVGDIDQATAPRLSKVQHPGKLPNVLEADYHQKLQLKFSLKDKHANNAMIAHQAFVLLSHKSGREVIFIAESDASNVYKFELDVQAKSKIFGNLSGGYSLSLIVGDAVITNPFTWHLADIELTFHDPPAESLEPQIQFGVKPEITHIFREPEKRPPPVVSTTFTVLTLTPLLLLLILWVRIGINASNFRFNLGTFGFHLGLGSIFGLFTLFWLKLTMFETLRYLILLGIVTFLCGNSMLSKLAASKR